MTVPRSPSSLVERRVTSCSLRLLYYTSAYGGLLQEYSPTENACRPLIKYLSYGLKLLCLWSHMPRIHTIIRTRSCLLHMMSSPPQYTGKSSWTAACNLASAASAWAEMEGTAAATTRNYDRIRTFQDARALPSRPSP